MGGLLGRWLRRASNDTAFVEHGANVDLLRVLDSCAAEHTFPMLDNGYFYPAASRLSAFRSEAEWALVIEVFGFSPRSGTPEVWISTFGNRLSNRKSREDYVIATREDHLNRLAYENYLRTHPYDEFEVALPIEGDWQGGLDPDGEESAEVVDPSAKMLMLRGAEVPLPARDAYANMGIPLSDADRIYVFELCRYLAATARAAVLATRDERRIHVGSELDELLLVDEWSHPDVAGGEPPSETESFRQLARALAVGDASRYEPSTPPNNHWSNWPLGGTL